MKISAVWDIECAGWDEFLVGALWTPERGTRVYKLDPDGLCDALLALGQGAMVWAHAGGRYDVLWLVDQVAKRGGLADGLAARANMSGGTVASLAWRKGPTFRDSLKLMPMSLRRAAEIANRTTKDDLSDLCQCGESCGGYCALARDMPSSTWDRVIAYLVRDVETLRDALFALTEYTELRGIELMGTIGGTAWKAASQICNVDAIEWDSRAFKFARDGYYGGRVEVAQTRAPVIYRYDRHSAYPASLCESIPTGPMRLLDASGARMAWTRDKPGIYEVSLDVPRSHAPPLPIRRDNRLVYPHGVVNGRWTKIEIDAAISRGARLMSIDAGMAWAEEAPLLRRYSETVFEWEKEAPTKGLRTWLKYLRNSLTGKLGQSPEQTTVAIGDLADDARWSPVGRSPYVWSRETWRISDCAMPHWAATLTARARVELLDQIDHAGDEWVYSDTDSVYATRELTRRVGDALGEWGFEGRGDGWRAVAPKVYAYEADEQDGESWHSRAKGIRDAEKRDAWERVAAGMEIKDRGVRTLLQAARAADQRGLFTKRTTSRRVTENEKWCGARIRDGKNRTRAPHVSEIEDLP